MLSELFDVNLGLRNSCTPTIISKRNAIPKALDRSLKNLKLNVLDAELLLKVYDEHLFVAGYESVVSTGTHVLTCLAHVTHF